MMNLARVFYRRLSTNRSLFAAANGINFAERTTTFGFEAVTEEEKAKRGHMKLSHFCCVCFCYHSGEGVYSSCTSL